MGAADCSSFTIHYKALAQLPYVLHLIPSHLNDEKSLILQDLAILSVY